jgi:hypothetical protein
LSFFGLRVSRLLRCSRFAICFCPSTVRGG